MNTVITLTDATFEREVLDSDLPVLVEFWAQWRPPCRMIAPVLDRLAAERAGALRVAKLDVDANPGAQRDYRVISLPTLMLFHAAQPIRTLVGARSKTTLAAELDAALFPADPNGGGKASASLPNTALRKPARANHRPSTMGRTDRERRQVRRRSSR